MKIRMGFVSNSSTSSFLLYGAAVTEEEIRKGLGLSDGDDLDLYEILGGHLECHLPDGEYSYYIGRSWSDVGNEETGSQFKARVKKLIKKLLKIEPKLDTHDGSYYS